MKKIILWMLFVTIQIYSQWVPLTSPSSSTFNSVQFLNPNTGFICGNLNGNVIKTTDGGVSWIFTVTGSTSTFYDTYFENTQTGYVAGSIQQIVKTTNSGTNWDIKTSGSSTLYSLSFPTSTTGYSVGGSPTVLIKSTDGGNNWSTLTPPTSNILKSIFFVDNFTGWTCGSSGTIWKTTDGCTSWIPQTQSSSFSFEKIIFINPNNGIVIGLNGIAFKTTNSGTNWIQQSTGVTNNLYDIAYIAPNTFWAVGVTRILKSTDNGNTWLFQTNPSPSSTYNSIHMVDANTGYIVGNSGILLKTTNGGGPTVLPCFTKVVNGIIVNDNSWSQGCAWGDYDSDGDQDLVVVSYNNGCPTCTYPFLLYRNDGGTFTKILTGPIATEINRGFGCSWGDYDNDGRLDLFVAASMGSPNNLLYHNEGGGNFTKITSGSIVNDGGNSVGCAWIDYDRDGWLDMFVVNIYSENDFLYKNNGNGTFTKITSGTIVNDGSYGRGCCVGDYDNDGWIDIFIACFSGQTDRLYKNNGNGTFTLTTGVIPTDNYWGCGGDFGDYDNDGFLDLFVTNQNGLNRLYHNNGNGTFTLTNSLPSNETGPTSYGCVWADYDNDGRLDLYVSNFGGANAFLYKNNGSGNFSRVLNESLVNDFAYTVANSIIDINSDGKIDFFSTNNGSTSPLNDLLYMNNCGTGNYLGLKLKGCTLNKSAIGAKVIVKAGGITYIRELSGGQGLLSQSTHFQHFGLGSSTIVDSVIVRWTTGNVQRSSNVSVNQYILVDECLLGLISNTNEIPKDFSLSQNYPNPFNPLTKIKFALPRNTVASLKIFDVSGKEVSVLINQELQAGYFEYEFDANSLSSGIYFYKIIAGNFSETKKMVLVK